MSRSTTFLLATVFGLSGCTQSKKSSECAVAKSGVSEGLINGDSLDQYQVSIAIDGAPSKETANVADLLNHKQIGATFFIYGNLVEKNRDALIAARNAGHLIGNATYSGRNLMQEPMPAEELRRADVALTPLIVGDMFLFRAPDDQFSPKVAEHLNRQGLQKYVGPIGADIVNEQGRSIDLQCWQESLTAAQCAVLYMQVITHKKKGIVRFSDGYPQLIALFQELLPALSTAGVRILRLDQVPEIRRKLLERGAKVDMIAGPGGCSDY